MKKENTGLLLNLKKKESLPLAMSWMSLEDAVRSETSYAQKDKSARPHLCVEFKIVETHRTLSATVIARGWARGKWGDGQGYKVPVMQDAKVRRADVEKLTAVNTAIPYTSSLLRGEMFPPHTRAHTHAHARTHTRMHAHLVSTQTVSG